MGGDVDLHRMVGRPAYFVFLYCLCLGAAAADPMTRQGTSQSLQAYAGSYDTDAFLNLAPVRDELVSMLGDELEHFLENLDVRGQVDLVSGSLAIAGNAPHQGGVEEAVLCVATYNGAVSAAIFSEGAITVYSREPAYFSQSLCIKDWITQVNSGHADRFAPPGNVVMAVADEE